MADSSHSSSHGTTGNQIPIAELLVALIGANPFALVMTSFQQLQRGANELITSVERFNDTMEQMNLVASRVNRLLDDVEPPVRALLPQLTRSITAIDAAAQQLGELSKHLAPLGQLAESAGSLPFLRNLTGLIPGVASPKPETKPEGRPTAAAKKSPASKPAKKPSTSPTRQRA